MEESQEVQVTALQGKYKGYANLKPHQFKPGQSGNPSGKAKGTVSLKTWAQKYIQELDDEEKLEFIGGLDKIDIWKMGEGNPHATQDINAKVTMADVIKDIENGNKVTRQAVEITEPIQDTGQEEKLVAIPEEQGTAALQPTQVVEKYNPEEQATGVHN